MMMCADVVKYNFTTTMPQKLRRDQKIKINKINSKENTAFPVTKGKTCSCDRCTARVRQNYKENLLVILGMFGLFLRLTVRSILKPTI